MNFKMSKIDYEQKIGMKFETKSEVEMCIKQWISCSMGI